MLKKDPEGYKKLLVYKKAEEFHSECLKLAEEIKRVEKGLRGVRGERTVNKILLELADQIGRASRSPQSNIVEGWKRNTTQEYFEFIGYAIASAEEIHEDVTDVIKGKYPELMFVPGITGVKGLDIAEVEKLPFYPLDPLHPLIVQVKLRSKELTMLLYKLQQSLDKKMVQTGELPMKEKLKRKQQEVKEADEWLKQFLSKKRE